MKALGFQPVESTIPFKVLVSDFNLHPYIEAAPGVVVPNAEATLNLTRTMADAASWDIKGVVSSELSVSSSSSSSSSSSASEKKEEKGGDDDGGLRMSATVTFETGLKAAAAAAANASSSWDRFYLFDAEVEVRYDDAGLSLYGRLAVDVASDGNGSIACGASSDDMSADAVQMSGEVAVSIAEPKLIAVRRCRLTSPSG